MHHNCLSSLVQDGCWRWVSCPSSGHHSWVIECIGSLVVLEFAGSLRSLFMFWRMEVSICGRLHHQERPCVSITHFLSVYLVEDEVCCRENWQYTVYNLHILISFVLCLLQGSAGTAACQIVHESLCSHAQHHPVHIRPAGGTPPGESGSGGGVDGRGVELLWAGPALERCGALGRGSGLEVRRRGGHLHGEPAAHGGAVARTG